MRGIAPANLPGACYECLDPIRVIGCDLRSARTIGVSMYLAGDLTGARCEGSKSVFARGTKFFPIGFAIQNLPIPFWKDIPVNFARVTTSTGLRQSQHRIVLTSM